jgi:CelD/BcsL family acetyltransferase involved in cellulose biosynthesis
MIATRILRDATSLAAIECAWWDLWQRIPQATPFQSPAWLIPWWQHFHPGSLFVIAAERAGALVGLAPFYVEDGPLGRRLLPVGISVSDYHDVLLDPAFESDAGKALLRAALDAGDWDRWDLEELRPDAAALRLPLPPDLLEEAAAQSACPTLRLSGDLAAVLPKTKRRKLNLARNRAARRGQVEVHSAVGDRIPATLDHLYRLHGLRWTGRGESGVLANETLQQFHQAAAPLLAEAGILRLYSLTMDGEVAAAQYGFRVGDAAYAYLAGFDPAFEFESPGVILMAHAIEEALREGAREFHFLRGQEAYKYGWGAADRWNRRRTFLRSRSDDAAA